MTDDLDVADDAVAATPADTPAPQDTADELDRLLAEFTEATEGAPQKRAFDPDESARQANEALRDHALAQREALEIESRRSELQEAEQQLMLEQHRRDLADAVSEVRGELDKNFFDDQFVTTWLDAKASSDPQLQQLWLERGQNPQAARAAINRLANEFHEKFRRMPDPQVTEDREAVAQAVRGSGKAPLPEPLPDLGRLSHAEFRRHVRDAYGYNEPS